MFSFKHYFLISSVKSLKKVINEQKRLKTAEKSVLTSFRVPRAPESWFKYTTYYAILTEKFLPIPMWGKLWIFPKWDLTLAYPCLCLINRNFFWKCSFLKCHFFVCFSINFMANPAPTNNKAIWHINPTRQVGTPSQISGLFGSKVRVKYLIWSTEWVGL